MPDDPKVLEKEIPGIGAYTAAAICSIAFGVQIAAVDGNVGSSLKLQLLLLMLMHSYNASYLVFSLSTPRSPLKQPSTLSPTSLNPSFPLLDLGPRIKL